MEKFYEKLKEMPEKQFITLQWILGLICGLICWVAIRVSGFADEQLVTYILIALFLAIVFGSRSVSRKIERPLNKFNLGWALGLGICIVIFALFAFVISDRGLIEILFNIPV